MRFPLLLLIGLTAVFLLGCSSSEEETSSDTVTSEGVDVEKNPLSALSALSSLGKDLENLQQELEAMPDVEAAHFNDLMPALPEPLDGFTGEDPKGSTNQMGDTKISSVSRSYRAEDGDGRVDIEISDWAFHKALYVPFMMQSKFSQESTDGWSKGITMGADPGREDYKTNSESGERTVLYRKRFPIKIRIRNMPPEAFDEWWQAINKDELPTE